MTPRRTSRGRLALWPGPIGNMSRALFPKRFTDIQRKILDANAIERVQRAGEPENKHFIKHLICLDYQLQAKT